MGNKRVFALVIVVSLMVIWGAPGLHSAAAQADDLLFQPGTKVLVVVDDLMMWSAAHTELMVLPKGVELVVTAGQKEDLGQTWIRVRGDVDQGWVAAEVGRRPTLALSTPERLEEIVADSTAKLTQNPANVSAFFARGLAYLAQKNYDLAVADFTQVIRLDPNSTQGYLYLGMAHYYLKLYTWALSDLAAGLMLEPENAILVNTRGLVYWAMGDMRGQALADFDQAVMLDPNFLSPMNNRASMYGEQTSFNAAIREYTALLEQDPYYAFAYSNRALIYKVTGDFDRALEDTQRAIELDPLATNAYLIEGDVYVALYEFELALDDYTRAIETDPLYAYAYSCRASYYMSFGEYELSLQDWDKVIELEPENPDNYYTRGILLKELGDLEAALSDLRQASALGYGPDATILLGQVLMEQGNSDEAMQALTYALLMDNGRADAYILRAKLYFERGQPMQALSDLAFATTIDPENAEPYLLQADIYESMEQWQNVLSALTSAIDRYAWPDAAILTRRGALYYRLEQYTAALDDFLAATESEPWDPPAYKWLGDTYTALGRSAKAQEAYRQYANLMNATVT